MDEMALQLHRQMAYAFKLAVAEGESSGMLLTKVNARVGRKHSGEAGDPSAGLPDTSQEEYPGKGDWEVEVEYARADRKVLGGSRLPDGQPLPVLLNLFEGLPLTALKGIRHEWTKRFRKYKVGTIGELAGLDTAKAADICRRLGSLRPLEFHTQARLLERPCVVLSGKNVKPIPLHRLLLMGREEIANSVGLGLSGLEMRELQACVQIMNLVFDQAYFRKIDTSIFKNSPA